MAYTHQKIKPFSRPRTDSDVQFRNGPLLSVDAAPETNRRPQRTQMVSHLIAEIDLNAIARNIGILRSYLSAGCRFCVAVKANAYGHGMEVVLPVLEAERVDMLAVATVTEARQARELGWQLPILLMGTELSIYQGALKRDVAEWLVRNNVCITMLAIDDLHAIEEAAKAVEMPAKVHLKLDTGLSRMGVDESQLLELIERIEACPNVLIDGLYTHFASADERGCAFAGGQLQRFEKFVGVLRSRSTKTPTLHAANSAAVVNLPGSHYDMVRPGIGVYGYQTTPSELQRIDLSPVMRVVSSVMLVKRVPEGSDVGYGRSFRTKRESILGVVPIGYADGLDRRLSNAGFVTVKGIPAPIVGKISMDQTIIDLTEIANQTTITAGCHAVIMDNNPNSPNSVESMARHLDTIPYEIVTSISPRVVRLARRRHAMGEKDLTNSFLQSS